MNNKHIIYTIYIYVNYVNLKLYQYYYQSILIENVCKLSKSFLYMTRMKIFISCENSKDIIKLALTTISRNNVFSLITKTSVDHLFFWRIFTCGNRRFCPAGIEVPVEARNKKNTREKITLDVLKLTKS